MALSRLRTDAVVGKGAGIIEKTICRRWRFSPRILAEEVAILEQAAHWPRRGRIAGTNNFCRQMVGDYIEAYRRYCWPVNSVNDLKLAPFHLLATEGAVHTDKPHTWHMETLARLAGGIIVATPFHVIDLTDSNSEAEGIRWWEELTGRGGEGMVVKPLDFIVKGRRGLVQPAVKCRGREYLRIIYGPEYTATENLERLRARGLSTNVLWPCVNSHWVSNRWNVLSAKNRYVGFTKPSLACSRWKANQLTRDCKMSHQPKKFLPGLRSFRLWKCAGRIIPWCIRAARLGLSRARRGWKEKIISSALQTVLRNHWSLRSSKY